MYSGASVSVISRNFAALSNIRTDKLSHSLQLINASGEEMTVDGVIYPQITLTNSQQQKLGAVVVSPDLSTEEFLICTLDMVKLQTFTKTNGLFHKESGGLNNVGNKSWKPIKVSNSHISTSYFKSDQKVNSVNHAEMKSQPQFNFNTCFGFLAKFQNTSVAEISDFCNHEKLNNVNNCFVNSDIIEISSYNLVMSVNAMPKVSTELDQKTDQVQSELENSTTMKPVPSLLFEASDRFFGVVYNDVMQDTSCRSNTTVCPTKMVQQRHKQKNTSPRNIRVKEIL